MLRAAILPGILATIFVSSPLASRAQPAADAPERAFLTIPELQQGFRFLYEQDFPRARATFVAWRNEHPDAPIGPVTVAASYLFEEFYHQGVLTSDFFLDDEKFLKGIKGHPDAARMHEFRGALAGGRKLAEARLTDDPRNAEALYALTLAAGMESDADMILEKRRLDALHQMKAAEEAAKRLLAASPGICDADVAVGAAHYIIGSLSPGMRFALWFGGIHGDKARGMREVSVATGCGQYLRPFAKIMLALAARREHQPELATRLLAELTAEFPASPLFASEYAKVQRAGSGTRN